MLFGAKEENFGKCQMTKIQAKLFIFLLLPT